MTSNRRTAQLVSVWPVLSVVSFAALIVLVLAPVARANNISGTYRDEGWFQAATGSDGYINYVTSQNCNGAELDAYDAVRTSTNNASGTFGNRWPSGIRMVRESGNACTGTLTNVTDIRLIYLTTDSEWHNEGHTTHAGGEEHGVAAPDSYCDLYGVRSPCGLHPSKIHINGPKYDDTSAAGRSRLLMHETGHSQGLSHHCSSDSVMNDGSSDCNGGTWLNVTGYKATDRSGVVDVYPNWQYN